MTGETSEKKQSDWNDGKRSTLALDILSPVLKEQADQIINNLKNLYASGDTDAVKYIAAVAQLKAMDDLKANLQGKVSRGNRAAKELIGG